MAQNIIHQFDETASLPVADGTVAGSPVVVGGLTGVALTSKSDGDTLDGNPDGYATVRLVGTAELEIVGAGTAAVGTPIYVAAGTPATATLTATSNKLLGFLVTAKPSGSGAKARVRLAGGHASQA